MVVPSPLDALGRIYDLNELSADPSPIAVVDRRFVIHWLNPAWARFAEDNGAPDVAERHNVGTCYLDGIAEPLLSFYRSLFTNVMTTGDSFEHSYECSSPIRKRLFRVRAVPLDQQGLFIEHSLVRNVAHEREPAIGFEGEYRDEVGHILQCSNCRRVRRRTGEWDWVPRWVAEMPTGTSHGLCAPCASRYFHEARRARAARAS